MEEMFEEIKIKFDKYEKLKLEHEELILIFEEINNEYNDIKKEFEDNKIKYNDIKKDIEDKENIIINLTNDNNILNNKLNDIKPFDLIKYEIEKYNNINDHNIKNSIIIHNRFLCMVEKFINQLSTINFTDENEEMKDIEH